MHALCASERTWRAPLAGIVNKTDKTGIFADVCFVVVCRFLRRKSQKKNRKGDGEGNTGGKNKRENVVKHVGRDRSHMQLGRILWFSVDWLR
jgi:hypothetical protein